MKRLHSALLSAFLLIATTGTTDSRTWRVNTMGTGDAPTLQAAMDSAVAGDSVLVAAGVYSTGLSFHVPAHVTLISESGPVGCTLRPGEVASTVMLYLRDGANVIGFTFRPVQVSNIVIFSGTNQEISYNIIPDGGTYAIDLNDRSAIVHNNTIISGSISRPGYSFIFNNILLGSVDCNEGDYGCNLVSVDNPSQGSLNFGADPLFCGTDNYYLRSDSPALPENSPVGCSSYLGALPMGCQVVPVETKSWGAVKALYE